MCPAYFDTGFSVRQPMWHGGGLVLEDHPDNWADARKLAGLEWEPMTTVPFFVIDADRADEWIEAHGDEIGGWERRKDDTLLVPDDTTRLILRDDTFAPLGRASDQFSLIHHSTMGEILDALLDAGEGALKYETAGSCRGGRDVWALVYLDEPFTTPGDEAAGAPVETYPYVALLNSHDGTGACKAVRTCVRVVCWNTFQMASAEADRSGLQFVFRHVGDVEERLTEARGILDGMRKDAADYTALAAELTQLRVDDKRLAKFVSEFLPNPAEHGEVVSERVEANVDKAREMFKSMYLNSETTAGVRGTGWGLLQTSTEYLDHARAYRSQDSYMGRSILKAEPAKAKALEIVRRVCK